LRALKFIAVVSFTLVRAVSWFTVLSFMTAFRIFIEERSSWRP
jgi:hypothetical protein